MWREEREGREEGMYHHCFFLVFRYRHHESTRECMDPQFQMNKVVNDIAHVQLKWEGTSRYRIIHVQQNIA